MKKWYKEDWSFRVTVISVGDDDNPRSCRLGFEPGDEFSAQYACPEGFCPTAMGKLVTIEEVVRAGGDLTQLGGDSPTSIEFICPSGVVIFSVRAERQS